MNTDPTHEEMRAFIATAWTHEVDDFDAEAAIYWFANDYHGGQSSNLYSVLSTSNYHPGACESEVEPDTMAEVIYLDLEAEFAPK